MADSSFDEILEKISNSPDIIDKLTSITKGVSKENPYESLPEIMEAIAPVLNAEKNEKTDTPTEKTEDSRAEIPLSKISEKIAKNSKLLIALKPYLSRERCEIIDTVVKISQVTDLMKLVK